MRLEEVRTALLCAATLEVDAFFAARGAGFFTALFGFFEGISGFRHNP
jgi:hypothetical protein